MTMYDYIFPFDANIVSEALIVIVFNSINSLSCDINLFRNFTNCLAFF